MSAVGSGAAQMPSQKAAKERKVQKTQDFKDPPPHVGGCNRLLLFAFMPSFKGELGDARFVQFSKAFFDHAIVLLLGGGGQGEIKTFFFGEIKSDSRIFGRMSAGEEAGM